REMGFRLREYCPVGELLPGIAYFVRRLLENTSNEGFLANTFAKGAARNELLNNPANGAVSAPAENDGKRVSSSELNEPLLPSFRNEPPIDFAIPSNRAAFRDALAQVRSNLGRRYPLVLGNKEVQTRDWLPSLNPANQKEIVGYS